MSFRFEQFANYNSKTSGPFSFKGPLGRWSHIEKASAVHEDQKRFVSTFAWWSCRWTQSWPGIFVWHLLGREWSAEEKAIGENAWQVEEGQAAAAEKEEEEKDEEEEEEEDGYAEGKSMFMPLINEEQQAFKKVSIRKFDVPSINNNAKIYPDLFNWTAAEFSELPLAPKQLNGEFA